MRNIMYSRVMPASKVILGALVLLTPAVCQDRRIAIYDFNSKSADISVRGKIPPSLDMGHQAAGLVMTQLVNSPTHFEVIERAEIERILKEQGKKFDENFDAASAPELGRLLNVDGIVFGEVDSASANVSGSLIKVPHGPTVGKKNAKAKVHMSVRLVSTQTGTIQVAQAAEGDATVSVGSSVSGVGAGSDSDDHTAMGDAVNQALQKAVGNISAAIIAKAGMLPKISHPGAPTTAANGPAGVVGAQAADRVPIINSVDGNKVYIEGGQDLKIAVGERYDVRTVTKTITLSNGTKSEVRERVETVVIDDVQEGLSIAHVEGPGDSKAKAGDRLVKATSLPAILAPPPAPATKKKSAPTANLFVPATPPTQGAL